MDARVIPTVYVFISCRNAAETIDRTLQSVLSQTGDLRLHCHVEDAGSTDGTPLRLAEWQRRLDAPGFRPASADLRFSHGAAAEDRVGVALVRAVDRLAPPPDAFVTLLEAGATLRPGAAALAAALARQFAPNELSWFGGADAVLGDRPIPPGALAQGLCDDRHWTALRPAGTFFRSWLWTAADPGDGLAAFPETAGWALWRQMAGRAGFAQVGQVLAEAAGDAAPDPGRLEPVLPTEQRRAALAQLGVARPVTRRVLQPGPGGLFALVEDSIDPLARQTYRAVFGAPPPWPPHAPAPPRVLAQGRPALAVPTAPLPPAPDADLPLHRRPGLVALDADWQYPAITEQHAFQRLASTTLPGAALYVGYPWATLIDKIARKTADLDLHRDRFARFCAQLPQGLRKVTVCQHIHGRRHADLFRQAGIDTVFWSHATRAEVAAAAVAGPGTLRFLPFPLYPVQVPAALPGAAPEADAAPRPYLFSFIGARANRFYLTGARNWILDLLKDDPRGLVIGRDSWHYQKVVYDLQVRGDEAAPAAALVDDRASDEFRESLLRSTFSLCPSGSGPNSIRLWESLGAGAIPVILADTWAPPGDPRLWERAAVRCAETAEAIAALPDRLAAIAADPARLAAMRHAMRQIWLLYGPDGFVPDVLSALLEQDGTAPADGLAAALRRRDDPAGLLLICAGALLLDPEPTLQRIAADADLALALGQARGALATDPAAAPLLAHHAAVLAQAGLILPDPAPAAPATPRRAVPRICLWGRHSHRTPLSYAPIRRLLGDRVEMVADPAAADLLVTGFNIDLRETAGALRDLLRRPAPPKLAVISEEPLWDVTWSGPFTGREGRIAAGEIEIGYACLGHDTSAIYDFERLPYFVLTDDRYPLRYAALMARFAELTPAALLQRWRRAPVAAAFFAEVRRGAIHAGAVPGRDITRLSSYRTGVAEAVPDAGVLRVGKGWGAAGPRQDLPDWHLDKLAQLDGRARVVSAYENVAQRCYITEKIFDAFAVGGIPTYWAGPGHRVFELVPRAAMLETSGLAPAAAAARIAALEPDAALAEAWLEACRSLAARFGDLAGLQAERRRVAEAVLAEIRALL